MINRKYAEDHYTPKPANRPKGRAPVPDGTVKVYLKPNGDTTTWIKNGRRWDYIVGSFTPCPTKERKPCGKAAHKNYEPKATTAKQTTCRAKKRFDSAPKVCNDSNPDHVSVKDQSGGEWVRIDSKTTVYRKNSAA